MPKPIRFTAAFAASLCLSSFSFAAPPAPADNTDVLAEKVDEKLSKHKVEIARSAARLKRKIDKGQANSDGDISEELEVMADVLEEAFAKDGLFRDLAAMFSDFAEDIDVDTDDGKTVLRFDGATVGQIEHSTSRDSEDSLSISGLGKNLTLDRQTIVKDGKSKTRIVIEMDGADEIDIILPELD